MLMVQHKAPHRFWLPPVHLLDEYVAKDYPEPENLFDDYGGRGTPAQTQDMTLRVTMDLALDNKMVPFRQDRMNEAQKRKWNEVYDGIRADVLKERPQGDDLVRWKYQRYMADYLACIKSLDESVGTMLEYLDESGLAENTVVIYASDQGFFLGEHGWFDKRFMYEESLRTPLLVRWPGVAKAGSVNKRMVSNLDFAQTFLDLAGLEQPSDMQGKSLKPLFEGEEPSDWRESVYYHYYCFPEYHAVRRHDKRNSRYKLMHFYDLDEWELYDLEKDPREMQSVHADPAYAEALTHMKGELTKLRKQYEVPAPPALAKGRLSSRPGAEFGTFEIGLPDEGWTSLFDGKSRMVGAGLSHPSPEIPSPSVRANGNRGGERGNSSLPRLKSFIFTPWIFRISSSSWRHSCRVRTSIRVSVSVAYCPRASNFQTDTKAKFRTSEAVGFMTLEWAG